MHLLTGYSREASDPFSRRACWVLVGDLRHLGVGAGGEELFPHLGAPSRGGGSAGMGGTFGGSGGWRGVQQLVCRDWDEVGPVHVVQAVDLRTLAWVVCLLVGRGTGCQTVGFRGWTPGGDSCWR